MMLSLKKVCEAKMSSEVVEVAKVRKLAQCSTVKQTKSSCDNGNAMAALPKVYALSNNVTKGLSSEISSKTSSGLVR